MDANQDGYAHRRMPLALPTRCHYYVDMAASRTTSVCTEGLQEEQISWSRRVWS